MFWVQKVYRRLKMTGEAGKNTPIMHCFTIRRYCCLFLAISFLTLMGIVILLYSQTWPKTITRPLEHWEQASSIPASIPIDKMYDDESDTSVIEPMKPSIPSVLDPQVSVAIPAPATVPVEKEATNSSVEVPSNSSFGVPSKLSEHIHPTQAALPQINLSTEPSHPAEATIPPKVSIQTVEGILPSEVANQGIQPSQVAKQHPQVYPLHPESGQNVDAIPSAKDQFWKYMFNIWKQAVLANANSAAPFL